MDNKPQFNLKQSSGLGSDGNQKIEIDASHNDNRQVYYNDPEFKNLTATHVGGITFDPISLREVIISINDVTEEINKKPSDFTIVDVEKKNQINGLSQEFYDNCIAIDYEPYFNEFDAFLKLRENEDLQNKILNIANSLNRKILMNRSDYDNFEKLLSAIEDSLIDSQYTTLKGKESIVVLVLYYLYASCLIGKKTEGENKC